VSYVQGPVLGIVQEFVLEFVLRVVRRLALGWGSGRWSCA
jgi:hypothetical protein